MNQLDIFSKSVFLIEQVHFHFVFSHQNWFRNAFYLHAPPKFCQTKIFTVAIAISLDSVFIKTVVFKDSNKSLEFFLILKNIF